MIRALILDDEPLAVRQLEMYVSKVPYMEVVASCTSAAAARRTLEQEQVDVLYVDINMPDISGLEFVRSMEQPPAVVFTTAYSEYALEGFRVNAVDYLLKPFSLKEFIHSADKVREIVELRRVSQPHHQVLQFRADHRTVLVDVSQIRYIESMSEYIKIFLDGQAAPLVVLYSLKRLCTELPRDRFMRIHRSYVVSLNHIREASGTSVVLRESSATGPQGTQVLPEVALPVGELYRHAFKSWIEGRR